MICRLLRPYRLRKTRAARERAQEAFNQAFASGDTRRMHRTHKALCEATHAVMRLELGE